MDRDRLVALLSSSDPANQTCRHALQHDADFTITTGPLPASHYARIYRRRAKWTKQQDRATIGFDEAVEKLEAAGDQAVCLGWVDLGDPPCHFQLFMAGDLSAVVACLGIERAGGIPTPRL